MSDVTVVIGAGQIGQAIARRVSAGKHVVLTDLHQGNADAAAEVLANAGFEVSTATVDVSSRESVHALAGTATALGDVTGVIHAAGVSPSQATPEAILAVGPVRNSTGPGRVREHHRAGWVLCRHRIAVRPPSWRPDGPAGRSPRHHTSR